MENEENNKYGIYKSCGKCGHKTFISLTKVEAAFNLFDNIELLKNEYTKEEEKVMAENRNKVLPELQKRKEKILSYKNCIWEYIWREVEKVIY